MDLTSRPLFWTLIAFLVVHILIMVSSLRIMYEEKRVMEGSLAPEHMTFSAFDAVNNMPILASSVFFYILGLSALILTVEKAELASILKQRPDLMNEYAEYLVCAIVRGALSSMSSTAREALSLDLGPVIDKQMTAMKDAISSETKSRLEGIKSLPKRT
ncbi:MAG: hypothetical protein GY877_04170 [Hyphomicrobium sp.]|nr:hypothetical protein [Hyphomicrobium sp.]